jgi:hypothetical protein
VNTINVTFRTKCPWIQSDTTRPSSFKPPAHCHPHHPSRCSSALLSPIKTSFGAPSPIKTRALPPAPITHQDLWWLGYIDGNLLYLFTINVFTILDRGIYLIDWQNVLIRAAILLCIHTNTIHGIFKHLKKNNFSGKYKMRRKILIISVPSVLGT